MKLHHFTCIEHLSSILSTGLYRGEVCTTSWQTPDLSAVWLTTDVDPSGHGLGDREEITEDFSRAVYQKAGIYLKPGSYFPNKRRVKITVDLHPSDARLFRWTRWAKRHVHPVIRESLISTGGGMMKARTWYVYFGVILPEEFLSVEVDGRPYSAMKEAA